MIRSILSVCIVGVLLTACASTNDAVINAQYMEAEIRIAEAKSAAITEQAKAISRSINESSSELERYLAREQLSRLEVTESGLARPTNGNDVAIVALKEGKGYLSVGGATMVGYKGVKTLGKAFERDTSTEIKADNGSTINVNKEKTQLIGQHQSVTNPTEVIMPEAPPEEEHVEEEAPEAVEEETHADG